MNKLLIITLFAAISSNLFGNTPRWTANDSQFSTVMTVTAVVVDAGEEIRGDHIELGAFSGAECRGSVFLQYIEGMDRYLGFLMIYGEGGETITLKVYDHATNEEYDANNEPLSFVSLFFHGEPLEPFIISIGGNGSGVLIFDVYVATKWNNNTFMLDLNRLQSDGYNVTACIWYKDGDELIGDGFTYSAGSLSTNRIAAGVYHFVLTTRNHGNLRSTDKIIGTLQNATVGLRVFPNPVTLGAVLTIENIAEGSAIEIYNQSGFRVSRTIAVDNPATLNLNNLPAGVYVVRTASGEVKIIIET